MPLSIEAAIAKEWRADLLAFLRSTGDPTC
jgi:hypothetical protein